MIIKKKQQNYWNALINKKKFQNIKPTIRKWNSKYNENRSEQVYEKLRSIQKIC